MGGVPPRPVTDVPEEPPDPTLGRTIAGKFAVERRLGAGAMGVVYLARQLALEKAVAIKVLNRELATDETFTERFRREAKAASRLDHPNSIRVFDFGQEPDGLLYLAMEYVEGRDLFALLLERGPLPATSIVELLSQVLAALAVAHDLGVLHRDLKPENIMIVRGKDDEGRESDVVKVCDFGIAKIVGTSADPSPEAARKHTTSGLVVGTPAYMSPEQARGEALDGRSDLYAVGVVLYELLTGRVPFEGDSPLSVVLKHLGEDPPPPSTRAPSVDRGLEAICMKALRKNPSERFQSAREMRLALRAAVGASPALPRGRSASSLALADTAAQQRLQDSRKPTLEGLTPLHSTPPARRPRPWVVTVLVVAAAGTVLVVGLRAGRQRQVPLDTPTASQTGTTPSTRAEPELPPAETVVSAAPVAPAVAAGSSIVRRVTSREMKPRSPKSEVSPGSQAEAIPAPALPTAANDVPPPTLASPPPLPPGAAPLAVTANPSTPAPPPPPPPAPAYDLRSAHVEIGLATGAVGATASSVTRAVSEAGATLTTCYRAALPGLTGPVDGHGMIHVETDGAGIITGARLTVPMGALMAGCVASAILGRRVANVDTGSASADVGLAFKAR